MSGEDEVLGNLVKALEVIEGSSSFAKLIPEIRTNIVYALPDAEEPSQVAGIKGRITVVDGKPRASGLPGFGASSHLARIMIVLMKADPSKRAAINLMHDEGIEKAVVAYCESKGLVYAKVDRGGEPEDVMSKEGSSMQWVAKQLSKKEIPDIAFAVGGKDKEPSTVILGETALEVAERAVDIAQYTK